MGKHSTTRNPFRRSGQVHRSRYRCGFDDSKILSKLTEIEDLLKMSRQAGMPSAKDDLALRQTSKPLTFKEACAYLGYAPSYLYKLTYRNVIPHYKPTGKMIFFSKNELDEWIYKSGDQLRVMSDELKTEDASATLGTSDPNSPRFESSHRVEAGQVEMFEKQQDDKREKKDENEIVIEFPLKSRRRKEL